MRQFVIPDEVLPYLVAQRGEIDRFKADRDGWVRAYHESLQGEFRLVDWYLPHRCESVLDVGGGMGGIDILFNDHYGGNLNVTLLDGVNDPPVVRSHNSTFNNMAVAEHFLRANGVRSIGHIDAANPAAIGEYDLIVSFRSWCFHYEPARYLDLVRQACHPDTMLILDVRRWRDDWVGQLEDAFRFQLEVYAGAKTLTRIYTPRV